MKTYSYPTTRNGSLHSSTSWKAEILNNQFSSVFTTEDLNNSPDLKPSSYNKILLISTSLINRTDQTKSQQDF